jgi:hypothetical protein
VKEDMELKKKDLRLNSDLSIRRNQTVIIPTRNLNKFTNVQSYLSVVNEVSSPSSPSKSSPDRSTTKSPTSPTLGQASEGKSTKRLQNPSVNEPLFHLKLQITQIPSNAEDHPENSPTLNNER